MNALYSFFDMLKDFLITCLNCGPDPQDPNSPRAEREKKLTEEKVDTNSSKAPEGRHHQDRTTQHVDTNSPLAEREKNFTGKPIPVVIKEQSTEKTSAEVLRRIENGKQDPPKKNLI